VGRGLIYFGGDNVTRLAMTKSQKLQKIMNDFELFAKNFIYIINSSNQKIRFELNEAQKELDKLLENNRFVIINKARKAGISTYMLAKALWRCVQNDNESILIVSYKSDSAKYLFETLKKMNDWLPRDKYLFPETKRDNRDELLLSNGSRIVCSVAGAKEVARGFSPSWVHLSEFAYYDNQEKQLTSIEQSLLDTGKITIETTANGMNNYYYKLFMSAWKGNSKYKPYFIPFYHDLYKKQFKNQHDEAEAWFKATNKGKRLSPADLEKDEKLLYEKGVSLRFLMWRRYKLLDMSLKDFWQEFPSNPHESFNSTDRSTFDQTKILEQLNHTLPALTRDELDELKGELPDSLVQYVGRGLEIYHLPKHGKRYFGGVDVASGNGQGDYSTIIIFDDNGEQVASFNRNDVPIYRFADVVRDLGRYFNYAFLVIERNGFGTSLLERLRKDTNEPYLNLYRHRHFDHRGGSDYKLGFPSTAMTKSQAITDLKEAFETRLIHINCRETLQQMQTYSDTGNNRIDGHHHDLVISLMLACVALKANRYYVDVAN